MKSRHRLGAAAGVTLAALGLLAAGGAPADARPSPRWHVSITQITRWCAAGTTLYFQLERLDGNAWSQPDGVRTVRVQTRSGTGWRDLGQAETAPTGSAGTFSTFDPFSGGMLRVQAPDGTWSFPILGGDLCTMPVR